MIDRLIGVVGQKKARSGSTHNRLLVAETECYCSRMSSSADVFSGASYVDDTGRTSTKTNEVHNKGILKSQRSDHWLNTIHCGVCMERYSGRKEPCRPCRKTLHHFTLVKVGVQSLLYRPSRSWGHQPLTASPYTIHLALPFRACMHA